MFLGTLTGLAFQALTVTNGEKERILNNNLFVPMYQINSLTTCLKKGAGLANNKTVVYNTTLAGLTYSTLGFKLLYINIVLDSIVKGDMKS